ncbi:chemotaxis protein CheC [Geomonas sp. RF6]|uniref:chemotaxis protein CheC n=1 Tax=Geomonas sp. RF6 TaxID=2897342 RepID=UPI001E2FD8F2|nr:chemotaxis protein CheC [Geomonas sp. RF6]UFS71568.1 chemotaxis protein CheC [Geomonas sp. RF6]
MKRPEKPSPLELDALAETGNIGMGHAAVALSSMMKMEVVLEVPNLRILDPRLIAPPVVPEQAVGLSMEIFGGVCGSLLILLPHRYALQILGKGGGAASFVDADVVPLVEGGREVAAAYLHAVGMLLNLPLSPSEPVFECAAADAIAEAALARALAIDPPLIIQTVFTVPDLPGEGRILLIPGAAGVEAILGALGTR